MNRKALIAAPAIALALAACAPIEDDSSPGGDTSSSAAVGTGSNAEDTPGRFGNPLDVTEGEAFEVDGFEYAEGWKLKNTFGSADVKKLKVTNSRGKSDSALITMKFWKGSEVLGSVDCSSEPIAPDTTVTLSCFGDKAPKRRDRITVEDSF